MGYGGRIVTVRFFPSPDAFRRWLERHHTTDGELWVGFYKKASGRPTLTWSEAVDEALCFGWIDGVRKRVDAESYTNRFTPRRPGSNWSLVNVRKVAALKRAGRMHPSGLAVFKARTPQKNGVHSYEQRKSVTFDAESRACFKADAVAWTFFERQPPGYRHLMTWWVMSAKRPETRAKRLATLVATSCAGKRVGAS